MKRKNRALIPFGLMVSGGLLVVGALIFAATRTPGGRPASTPTSFAQPEFAPQDDVPRVSVGDAKAAFDLKQAVFVDTRDDYYYQQSHIPGALSIPIDELESRLDELDPADWIIAYCT